jgi:hypothetical protein
MKSPKAVLSESIAEALATYFVIEPSQVETNLLKDAGVTLRDVKLQPITQRINPHTSVDINGTVREAAFHWNWGSSQKDGGSSLVNSAKLTLSGLDFRAFLRPYDEQEADLNDKTTTTTTTKEEEQVVVKKKGKFGRYVEDQVNRIIDTLTLSITDFKFKIQIDDTSLVYGGESIRLDSVGRTSESGPLKQTLTVRGIFANVVAFVRNHDDDDDDDEVIEVTRQSFPLLEPFSYTTSCIRTSGKRFQGGIATGLDIRGPSQALQEESGDTSPIVMHAGKNQLEFLNILGGYLLTAETPNTTTSSTSTENSDEENQQQHQHYLLQPTVMNLPLKGLALVFPNGSKISVDGLLLQYIMDGTKLKVSGHDGFAVNDAPFLDLPDSCQWEADLVTTTFRVYRHDDGNINDINDNNNDINKADIVASIRAREKELQHVKDGMLEMVNILQGMTKQDSGAAYEMMSSSSTSTQEEGQGDETTQNDSTSKQAAEKDKPSSSSPWKVDLAGGVDICLLNASDEVTIDCLFHNVQADSGTMTFSVESIDKVIIPGTIRLKEPIKNTTMTFDGTLLQLKMGAVVLCLEEPPESQKPGNEDEELERVKSNRRLLLEAESSLSSQGSSSSDDPSSTFVLPFACIASIESTITYETDGETLHTSVKALDFAVGPDMKVDETGSMVPTGGVRTLLVMEEFHHKMVQVVDPKITAVVRLEKLDRIEAFDFNATSIGIAAGYSVLSWKRLMETGDQNRKKKDEEEKKKKNNPTILPFARVRPLKINIALNKGKIINWIGTEGSTVHFNEFKGNEKTTSEDLFRFYTTHMISNVPGVVLNANVLGFDVGDTAATQVGIATGAGALSALGGGAVPVASVLGMVGFDGIKGTINAGKRGRGAAADDKTQFKDLFRGVGQAIKEASQDGAKSRGKSDEQRADALDWAVGATRGVGDYTDKNKARLGGAGAGAVGFAYGMLLGGPVGAVAGALIAGTTASVTIDVLDTKFKKKPQTAQIENGGESKTT